MGLKSSFRKWKDFFDDKGGWDKILSDLATAKEGTRAWPNRTKDHAVSFRVDYGQLYTTAEGHVCRNLVLQANKGTKNPRAAAVANADSHQVLATVPVYVNHPPDASEFAAQLAQQLE